MSSMSTPTEPPAVTKPIHTILLDSSPLLLNTPGISTLLANGHVLVTTPSVLSEIKDKEARSRVDTMYMPFLVVRSPKPESLKFVKEFARKTGDATVLSQTDFEVLALAYDLECERNNGDWRLRSNPGQKRVNGSPPEKNTEQVIETDGGVTQASELSNDETQSIQDQGSLTNQVEAINLQDDGVVIPSHDLDVVDAEQTDNTSQSNPSQLEMLETEQQSVSEEEDDSGGEWITPSNIKKKKLQDDDGNQASKKEVKTLQVATMTGDFAMQNVLLQINLNLLSTKTCKRVTQIKQYVLRCHACFNVVKDMSKQFCPRCGKPTLTRVSCTTSDKGEVRLHLKANMQWNNKGNVYSVPKPTSGTANQKWKGPRQGGGQRGWGNDLVLAEDQKEYIRAMSTMKRSKEKDLMDEDLLPGILSGDRNQSGGRVRVGAGKNINSRKR